GCFGERDAIAINLRKSLCERQNKTPPGGNPRAFALPREIGVTDLRWRGSVLDEALLRAFVTRAARGRPVAVRPQCSRVGDVEEGRHGSSCCENVARWRRSRTLRACFFSCKGQSDERSSCVIETGDGLLPVVATPIASRGLVKAAMWVPLASWP